MFITSQGVAGLPPLTTPAPAKREVSAELSVPLGQALQEAQDPPPTCRAAVAEVSHPLFTPWALGHGTRATRDRHAQAQRPFG